jgi:PAS domain S-box-containing protein
MNTIADLRKAVKEPVVVVDQRGSITDVNAAFERVFGWLRQEILGRPLTTIIPQSLHEEHRMGFSRFMHTGIPTLLNRPISLKAVTKDGHVFNAEHFIVAECDRGSWTFAATIRPLES